MILVRTQYRNVMEQHSLLYLIKLFCCIVLSDKAMFLLCCGATCRLEATDEEKDPSD
jgi:hypothetical protein